MSDYGVTTGGFLRKPLDVIKRELEDSYRTDIDASIRTDPESVFGQQIGIQAKAIEEQWFNAEEVYNSRFPSKAEGTTLDYAVSYTGIERLPERATVVKGVIIGANGTVVLQGTEASLTSSGELFDTVADLTISTSEAVFAKIAVTNIFDNADYTITLDTINYTINSGSGATGESITDALVDYINANQTAMIAENIGSNQFTLKSATGTRAVSLIVGNFMVLVQVGSQVDFIAQNTGQIVAIAGDLTTFTSTPAGVDELINYVDGILGAEQETDPELFARWSFTKNTPQGGTVPAIRNGILQNVSGAVKCSIFENNSLVTDSEGRPAKTFEAVVIGGDDTDIVEEIWSRKPPASNTYGNVTEIIQDVDGYSHIVQFSRVTNKYAHIKIEYTKSSEEAFPINGETLIANNVLAVGRGYDIGRDILAQEFVGPAYAVGGIVNVSVSLAVTALPTDTPTYGTSNISISSSELALFDLSRITVLEA